jgi:hypothetical protein
MAVSTPVVTSPDPDYDPPKESPDDKLIREAKKRFKRCSDWESTWRDRFVADIKFCNADARNMYQWPQVLMDARGYGTGDERPCLTVNKTRQHCIQIVNDGRQNKTSVKIKPVGDGATYEAAQVLEGVVRHIEYISNAQAVYTNASRFQVQGGIGYCRLVTRYVDDDSFDQDIFIDPIDDPLTVYGDPDYKEADGSDWRFGFVFADVDKEQFKTDYPDLPPMVGVASVLGNDENAWVSIDKVRVAEYYYRTEIPDELVVFTTPDGDKLPVKRSELKGMSGALREAFKAALDDPETKRRPIKGHEVKWVKIAGDQIIDRKDCVFDTIPIVFCIGEKTVIDGELDIKGHTRALIDPQNMYNYHASAQVEFVGVQSKTRFLASVRSIADLDAYWGRMNLDNLPVVPYNDVDDEGQPIDKPTPLPPPTAAPAYQTGMENAANDMMLVSGQYQAMMGEPSNEKSGKAIQARQRQGENATYHFIDNQAVMVRRIGKMIIQAFPKIYDTPRVIKILGEDGKDSDVFLDPDAKMAFEKRKTQDTESAEQIIVNPTIGRYDVMSDPGPDFATRRQEAFNALSQIATQSPELMAVIGDLVLLAADFPLADQAAERLKRMVPAQALGDGPNPQVVDLQKQLDAYQKLIGSLTVKVQQLQSKSTTRDAQKEVDVFKAVTDRLDILMKYSQIPAAELLHMQHDLAVQEHAANLDLTGKVLVGSLDADMGATQAA